MKTVEIYLKCSFHKGDISICADFVLLPLNGEQRANALDLDISVKRCAGQYNCHLVLLKELGGKLTTSMYVW